MVINVNILGVDPDKKRDLKNTQQLYKFALASVSQ